MKDEEFKEILSLMYREGLNSGDIGYTYWDRLIDELIEMRKEYQKNNKE